MSGEFEPSNWKKKQLYRWLVKAEKDFRHSSREDQVKDALQHYEHERYIACEKVLQELPTKEKLMEELLLRLRGKPVHKTVSKMMRGEELPHYVKLKGLFSLGTHLAIECEKGRTEYAALMRDVYSQIGKIQYDLT